MEYIPPSNEITLIHYGVLGMKWGVHRNREKAYRDKLTAISKNKSIHGTSDEKRIKYRNQSITARVGKTAVSGVAQMLIADCLTGKISRYSSMSKAELTAALTKKAFSLTATTATNVAINDALAKSASKRYTDSGKKVKGTKDKLISKEDAIEVGISTAARALPVLAIIMDMKMSHVQAERRKNEELFNSWGRNILPEKVDHVVWQSDDLKYAIIDNR